MVEYLNAYNKQVNKKTNKRKSYLAEPWTRQKWDFLAYF